MSVASQGIHVSPQNSTIVALGTSGAFTGVGESIIDYAEVDVVVYAEPANASGVLYFEFSPNNVDWDVSVPLPIADPTGYPPIPLRVILPFFRTRYVNDGVAQTKFHLTTVYHHLGAKMLTRFPGQALTNSEPLEVVTAVLRAQNPSGSYTTLKIDADGKLAILDGGAGKTLKTKKFSMTSTGTVIAAVASKRIKVYAVKIAASNKDMTVNFRDDASTLIEEPVPMGTGGGTVGMYIETLNPPAFLFATSAGNSLDLVMTGTGTVSGRLSYWDDDAT